ncbi:hypothetical protein E2P81_ATG09501 [Venturia nashicola]|uniref:Uncharacterized protein n=1 Tax=Venturia nashicola TaxID=86259 RepID=A0A4Z1NQI6_9PEZI|nr:hypothetical protein E6O75_ATG09707 [Venturia nashicola]TLD25844.1 hypothetical protein E2P81_ATG09501 [Venturia nashicola]
MPYEPHNRRQRRRAAKLKKKTKPKPSYQGRRKKHNSPWQRAWRMPESVWRYWECFWQMRDTIVIPLIFILMVVGTIYRIAFS